MSNVALRFSITNRNRLVARRGVTLLEVLVAMGVMVVGLMGLASLIPLGRLELAEGNRLDNTATLGRSAFREVSVRGYLRPEMWADPANGKSVIRDVGMDPVVNTPITKFVVSLTGATLPPHAPIVIDPLMVAPRFFGEAPNSTLTSAEQTHRQNCSVFPYSFALSGAATGGPELSSNRPKIARVTLRSLPPSVVGSAGNSNAFTMRSDVASRLFRSNDDLEFTVPTDKTEYPVQVFQTIAMSTTTVTIANNQFSAPNYVQQKVGFRQFRGDYSWFLVAQPSPAEMYSPLEKMPMFGGPAASPTTVRQFRVWVVVCFQRDLRDTSNMSLSANPVVGERAVWVDFVDRATARLRVHGIDNPQTARNVLDVKANHWIAVIGRCQNQMLGDSVDTNQDQYGMEWYRVLNVADEAVQGNNNNWYREVTLAGRDFMDATITPSGTAYIDADAGDGYTNLPSGTNPLTGWGVIVSGVRGVYEKTLYVDRPSLWAPYE